MKATSIKKQSPAKDEYTGTGIGLAIVKKIIDNHYGSITATSKVNKGTTFHIMFRLHYKITNQRTILYYTH